MVLIVIALLLFLFLGWLLFSPFRLVIDTRNEAYFVQWRSIGSARLLPLTDDLIIQLRILFWRKNFFPLQYRPEKKEKKPEKAKKKKRKVNFQKYKRKGLRLLRSFRIKALRLNLDTDDYVHNSYLYPVFYFLTNNDNRRLTINYQGESELLLIMENRPYRMMLAFLF